jgi:hypothetical protein
MSEFEKLYGQIRDVKLLLDYFQFRLTEVKKDIRWMLYEFDTVKNYHDWKLDALRAKYPEPLTERGKVDES